jgi:glycosyltransferase involved in cell wall biosynthesis
MLDYPILKLNPSKGHRGTYMQAIDVVMLTKNSEHLLEKCLGSLYQNVPINRLIIIDGFSTDRTLKILDQFHQKHKNVTVLSDEGTRARARVKGIQQVTTEWFMFADSDIVLSKDWFQKAKEDIQSDVGAVWGVNIDVLPYVKDRRILSLQTVVAKKSYELRGGTHDTLIRRDLVSDIRIPEQLHTYEDAYIMNHIRGKGYRTVIGNEIFCLHYKPPENWSLSNAVSGAILEFRCGLLYSKNWTYMAYYPFFTTYWVLQIAVQHGKKLFRS